MANLELIMNHNITPLYILDDNMMTPIVTIKFDKIYTFCNLILNTLQIFIQTAGFMMKEGFTEFFANLTIEKIVYILVIYILVIYNLLIMLMIDNQRRGTMEQQKIIESLNKEVNYLKKSEIIMREDLDELMAERYKELSTRNNQ